MKVIVRTRSEQDKHHDCYERKLVNHFLFLLSNTASVYVVNFCVISKDYVLSKQGCMSIYIILILAKMVDFFVNTVGKY